jgi:hypothetical protein
VLVLLSEFLIPRRVESLHDVLLLPQLRLVELIDLLQFSQLPLERDRFDEEVLLRRGLGAHVVLGICQLSPQMIDLL